VQSIYTKLTEQGKCSLCKGTCDWPICLSTVIARPIKATDSPAKRGHLTVAPAPL
jgi:hypothetical protein